MSILSKGIVIKGLELPKGGEMHSVTIDADGKALLEIDALTFEEHDVVEVEGHEAFGDGFDSGPFQVFFEKGAIR